MKRSPTDDRDSISRDFLSLLIVRITPQPFLAYVNHPKTSESFSKQALCEENCVTIGREHECTLFN